MLLTAPQEEFHLDIAHASMGSRVLIMGRESVLLTSRAKILENAGFECVLSGGLPAFGTLDRTRIAVAILCQSLGASEACSILAAVQEDSPETRFLRIAKWSQVPEPCFAHRLICPSPALLIAAVRQLAQESRIAL